MAFVSFAFVRFMIALFLVYFAMNKIYAKGQWIILLIASILFYAYASPQFLLFLGFSIFTTWGLALAIDKISDKYEVLLRDCAKVERKALRKKCNKEKSVYLTLCLFLNIGVLFFLKYRGLFGLTNSNASWIIVPLGISFYTFQSVGYCIDVSRGLIKPEKNIFRYALFVSYFPQIAQGPIGKYELLAPELFAEHEFDYNRFVSGLERALWGCFKKIVLANRIGAFVDTIYGEPTAFSGFILLLATAMYAVQLYADFSGYMDIAIGISNSLGIELSENFKTPYFSRSAAEYWRRWHMTLGTWFRDYLYYPILRSGWMKALGKTLNAKGYKRTATYITTAIALLITWVLTGVWHGDSLHFVFFGLYYGVIISFSTVCEEKYSEVKERMHIDDKAKTWRAFQLVRTLAIVCAGDILFRANSLSDVVCIIKGIFSGHFYNGSIHGMLSGIGCVPYKSWAVIIPALAVCVAVEIYEEKTEEKIVQWLDRRILPVRWGLLYLLIGSLFLFGDFASTAASSFLYFQF